MAGAKALLTEADEVVQRWHEQHRTGDREAFDRMNTMHTIEFAQQTAWQVRAELMG